MAKGSSPDGSPTGARVDRSDKIVAVARVFRRYGYEGTTISVLAEETGLGRSSLYHTFPGGKEDMARAVLALAQDYVTDQLMAPLAAATDPQAGARAFVATLRGYYEGGAVGCLYGALALHDCPPAIAAEVARLTQRWIAALEAVLAARGRADPAREAERIVRTIQGGLVLALAMRDPARFDAALGDVAAALEAG